MTNPEHIEILKQGVGIWNQWRQKHPEMQPDLRSADLSNTDLDSVNLIGARLGRANLQHAHLKGANFRRAHLEWTKLDNTKFNGANFNHADLRRASLSNADFNNSHLYSANLSNTALNSTCFNQADLRSASLGNIVFGKSDLTGALIGWTHFDNVDFRSVKGLETVRHEGPSSIGIDTIIRSQGNIPEIFLRKAGVPSTIIEQIPALVGSLKPIDYYTCFISYSSKDHAFVERLYADLQAKGVRCWFAPEDLKWGSRIRSGINEAIYLHDKLLLVLTKNSIASGWVEREVKIALAREKNEKRTVLFPVRLDKAVLDSPLAWATEIRHQRNIGDFTQWKNHDKYRKALERLLRDLKAST